MPFADVHRVLAPGARLTSTMARAAILVGCLALVPLASGGLNAAELSKMRYTVQSKPGIWDAALMSAIDNKFFEAEGLELEVISPATPGDGLKLVATGNSELATAHSTDVIIARSRGLPVVSVATNHQYGTSGIMIPADSGIKEMKDLEGKTLGVTGIPFNQAMLNYALKNSGVDPSKVAVVKAGFNQIPLLLSKRIDAIGDAIEYSEPATFNIKIGRPAEDKSSYRFFSFISLGVPRFYTQGIAAQEEALAKNPDLYRRFLRAWQKGVSWMVANQTEAVDKLLVRFPAVNRAEALADIAILARIAVSPETDAHGIGWQSPDVWAAQKAFMEKEGLITSEVDTSKAMTNAFLPARTQ
jgi:putative hydroxymethylpyrimidine transport system substrate-binding protein